MSNEHLRKQVLGFLNTPPIWKNTQFGIQQFQFPDIELQSFQHQDIPQNRRLGHQMEYMFKQLMEHSKKYELVLHNVPIRSGKQTIGEIDFILREITSQKLIHVELTYKFYIINPDITEPIHRLMGPNKRDMFFTKMEKIKNDQFPLLHSSESVNILNNNNLNHLGIKHKCCFKAQLFQYFQSENIKIRPLNKSCIMGYWMRFSDFKKEVFKSHLFYIPRKSEWVIAPHNQVSWKSHFEIMMDINLRLLKESAPMLWIKKSESEFEKFFVVWW